MNKKTILITGCSSGIGWDAAHGLRDAGWRVFATARADADVERLIAQGFEAHQLDYDDSVSIAAAVDWVRRETGGTLHALFNNGAYAIPGAVEDLPREAFRAIFESNVIGWQELTNLVIPMMRAQGYGRIVNCSSVLGLVPMKWRGSYVASKFALEGLTDVLRLELKSSGINVVLIEPGPITSDFRKNARKEFNRWIDWEASALSDLYRDTLIPRLNAAGVGKDRFELPASAVTKVLLKALETRRPAPRYFVTTPTYVANVIRRFLPTRISDMMLSGN